jgi:hypothetical protein
VKSLYVKEELTGTQLQLACLMAKGILCVGQRTVKLCRDSESESKMRCIIVSRVNSYFVRVEHFFEKVVSESYSHHSPQMTELYIYYISSLCSHVAASFRMNGFIRISRGDGNSFVLYFYRSE